MWDLGPSGNYLLIIALAAFAVGVHAHSMYGQRVPTQDSGPVRDPLSALALPTVAGEIAYRRGFVVYLIANELLFGLLISSSIILEISLNAIGRAEMVGALSSTDPLNPLIPILASTVVITASQLRPLSHVEQMIRGVAHRIAGIPRNLDSVQEQIRLTSITELKNHLEDVYEDANEASENHRLIDNALLQAQSVCASARAAGLAEFEAENLRISMTRVFCLHEWCLGYDGEQIWVSDDVKQITALFHSLKLEFKAFRGNLLRLCSESVNTDAEETIDSRIEIWEKMVSECLMLEKRLTVVLSLLLINKPDVELKKYPALAFLRDKTVEESVGTDRKARNALALTLLMGSFAGFISMIGYLSLEKTYRDWDRIQADKLQTLAPFGEPIDPNSFAYWLEYFSARMDNAFFETLDFTLIFAVSIWVALIARDALIVQKRWPRIVPGDLSPVGLYLYLGLLSYVPALLTFLILKFVVLMIIEPLRNGLDILDPISLKTFPGFLPEIITVPLIAFICVWFICRHIDQRSYQRRRTLFTTVKFAMLCGGLNFLLASLRGVRLDVDDAFAKFFIPTIVMFSLFHVFSKAYRWHNRVDRSNDDESVALEWWRRISQRRESRDPLDSPAPADSRRPVSESVHGDSA